MLRATFAAEFIGVGVATVAAVRCALVLVVVCTWSCEAQLGVALTAQVVTRCTAVVMSRTMSMSIRVAVVSVSLLVIVVVAPPTALLLAFDDARKQLGTAGVTFGHHLFERSSFGFGSLTRAFQCTGAPTGTAVAHYRNVRRILTTLISFTR